MSWTTRVLCALCSSLALAGCGRIGYDATGEPAPACGGHVGAFFCNGFEEPLGDPWTPWDVGAVAIVTSPVYRGEGALVADTEGPMQNASVYATAIGEHTSGDLYLRAYVQLPQTYTAASVELMAIRSSNHTSPSDATVLMVQNGMAAVYVAPISATFPSGVPVARDAWVCAELHIAISSTAGAMEAWIDGTLAVSESGLATIGPDGIGAIAVGILYTGPDQTDPAVVAVDEVVVSSAPIGCD